jgi:hypothetical protein
VYNSPININATLITPSSGEISLKDGGTSIKTHETPAILSYSVSNGTHIINASYDGNENYSSFVISTSVKASLDETESPAVNPVLAGSGSPGLNIQCEESWSCTPWSSCLNGLQSRTCADANNCGTLASKPAESQQCSLCNPNWNCTAWGSCAGGNQTRTCRDSNDCNSLIGMPPLIQGCSSGILPALSNIKTSVGITATSILSTLENSFEFLKEKPIYIAPVILSILSLALIIKFASPAIRFLKGFRINITRVNVPKAKK